MEALTLQFIRQEEIAENTFKYVFKKPDGFVFTAGQYLVVEPLNPQFTDDRPPLRSLSIASAPCEEELFFIMRHSESAFKKNLHAMTKEAGDAISVRGPVGHFVLPEDETQAIAFLVAGVGITPVRSMLVQALHENSQRPMTLICSNRTTEAAPCMHELMDVNIARYSCLHAITDEPVTESDNAIAGYVTADIIKDCASALENPLYYIVGTKGFIAGMKSCLEELSIDKERIIIDNFG